jgi:hypothetical protein
LAWSAQSDFIDGAAARERAGTKKRTGTLSRPNSLDSDDGRQAVCKIPTKDGQGSKERSEVIHADNIYL